MSKFKVQRPISADILLACASLEGLRRKLKKGKDPEIQRLNRCRGLRVRDEYNDTHPIGILVNENKNKK